MSIGLNEVDRGQ